MKFGIFYELQLPKPWEPDSELKLFQNALTQIELADKLGYDYAWEVEHHFLQEYSHSAAPEMFLAAASQRTKNIRLGHGIVQLTTNHPARVAERIATLDIISRGRVEMGMGEGASPVEFLPFGVEEKDKRAIFEDAVRCILPMFGEGAHEYKGAHFDFPPRVITPKPLQKPHPPLWIACSQLNTIEYAGRKGFGALGFQFVSPEASKAWVHAYYNAMTHQLDRLCDYPINPNIALVNSFMCAETDEEAQRRAEGIVFFQWALFYIGTLYKRGIETYVATSFWDDFLKWKQDNPQAVEKAVAGGLIGSPETIRKKLRQYEESHTDQVILLNQAGHVRHDHICESLELFAREVMPEFHANIPRQEEWKAEVLSGRKKLQSIDTTPFTPLTIGAVTKPAAE